jgi:hypothetical protein
MALKDTMQQLNLLLEEMVQDLIKAEGGNKSAAQRVRTRSIHLEKVAKMYRKESLVVEKKSLKAAKKVVAKSKAKAAPAPKKAEMEVADIFIKRPTAKLLSKKR